MIHYSLRCNKDHIFESWFQSADAFEKLKSSGMATCPICGSADVDKAIMAPRVSRSREKTVAGAETQQASNAQNDASHQHALTAPSSAAEAAMIELKQKIQDNSEYVGTEFASEARKIHEGEAPERSIYGEASGEEAKKLVDEGVPVAPLPFIPNRKTN